jgi:hypothetical protein
VKWLDAQKGVERSSSHVITASITNNTPEEQRAELVLSAVGLAGRVVHQPLRRVTLAAGASERVPVRLDTLPIQAESVSFATLRVEVTRADGTKGRAATAPLYYSFRDDYAKVTLHTSQDAVSRSSRVRGDAMRVEGRLSDDAGGALRAVTGPSTESPAIRRGLPQVRRVPPGAAPEAAAPSATTSLALTTSAAVAPVQVCTSWFTQYVDTDLGEDELTGFGGFTHVPASFALAHLKTAAGTVLWSGNLDIAGCTPAIALSPGSYRIDQATVGIQHAGITMNAYFMVNGAATVEWVSESFDYSGSASGKVFVGAYWISEATQVAAIMSHALVKNTAGPLFGQGSLGIAPGTYNARSNQNCP